jgi:hypothetical protein
VKLLSKFPLISGYDAMSGSFAHCKAFILVRPTLEALNRPQEARRGYV